MCVYTSVYEVILRLKSLDKKYSGRREIVQMKESSTSWLRVDEFIKDYNLPFLRFHNTFCTCYFEKNFTYPYLTPRSKRKKFWCKCVKGHHT